MTPTQKKSERRSTGSVSSRTPKSTTVKKKSESASTTRKDTIFLATSIIESAHCVVTRLGREVDEHQFKLTFEKLSKLYKEV